MTKTEAAEIMALDVRVWARKHGGEINKDLVEARISEWRGIAGEGTEKGHAASLTTWRATLATARRQEREF